MKRVFLFLAMTLSSLAMTVTAQSATIASGTCGAAGENLSWKLTDDQTLTISGIGAMTDGFELDEWAPWWIYRNEIKAVVIEEGITRIGRLAFANCSMTSVYLPNSLSGIGNNAFTGCRNLSITIPNSVTNVDYYAFTDVLNVVYNGNLSTANWEARFYNKYVENLLVYEDQTRTHLLACGYNAQGDIIIPNSVKSIENKAFKNCNGISTIYCYGEDFKIDQYIPSGASIIIGANVQSVIVRNDVDVINNITYLNLNTRVITMSSNAPTTPSALYDMNGDGTMEFVAYSTEGGQSNKINRYSSIGMFEGSEITADTYPDADLKFPHSNNDGILDYWYPCKNEIYLFESNNGNYIQKSMGNPKSFGSVIKYRNFYLDANLNGRTDFYRMEDADYNGFGGSHYIYYRQADGTYLKTELKILVNGEESDSLLHDTWTTSSTSGPMVTALENSLRNYMFLPENTNSNPYASLDMAIDIDQNGLIDLFSSTTGAALLNAGNNRFVQCKFPTKTIVKDLNNDNVPDYIMYDNDTKIVSLQISNSDGTINIQTLFQGMTVSNIWCHDFDNDGDIDILFPCDYTTTAGYAYLVFFRNDGNNVFQKIENAFDDPVYHFAFVDCKDIDNDGLYEIIAADSIKGNGGPSDEKRLYHGNYYTIKYNNRFKTSVDAEPFIYNSIDVKDPYGYYDYISKPDLLLGDFDNDGRLDYWYTHPTKNGTITVTNYCLSHFTPATQNTAPAKMSTPVCVLDTARKMIRLSWNRGSDTESPNMDLEYSIRIGSTSGASDIWFAAARADGKQRSILGGNVGANLSQWVNVADWPVGDYYIAVQAIDPNGLGGAWSDELVYHHSLIGADFNVSTQEMTTVDTLTIQFSGVVNPNYTYSWNFGDSAIIVEQNTNTQYYKLMYDSSGKKILSLQVTDEHGNSSVIETREVLVHALKIILTDATLTQTCFDMNMDGLMDALRKDGLYKGKADGTITKVPKTANSDLTFSCFNTGIYSYNYAKAMSFVDYNLDGLPDIVEETNKGNVLLNEEDYDFAFTTYDMQLHSKNLQQNSNNDITQNITNCSSIKWLDFNNDGWMDMNISNAEGRASYSSRYASINYGTEDRTNYIGGFQDRYINKGIAYNEYVGTHSYWSQWQSYVKDFNRDGYDDILTCFVVGPGGQYGPTEAYHLYLNYGEDRFVRSAFELPSDVPQRVDGVSDIDNDGYLDLLFVKNDKTILVLLGDAELTFANRAELRLPAEYQFPTSATFPLLDCSHDFDNNGYPDIVTANQGILYVHPNYQITVYLIPFAFNSKTGNTYYPFADLNNDGVPDLNGYSLQSRVTNQAPAVPQNLRVTEENGAVKLEWDAAIDRETPATQMRYNISVKKKGASVGQDSAFIISPMNGLYNDAAIIPYYPYKQSTQRYIPYRRFEIGQEYEFQIQSIDGWNGHSPMSDPLTFTVQKNTTAPIIETPTLVESITLTNLSGSSVLSQSNPQIIVEAIVEPDSAENKQLYWEITTGANKVTIEPDSNRCTITLRDGATSGDVVLTVRSTDGSGVFGSLQLSVNKTAEPTLYNIYFYNYDFTLLSSIQVPEGEIPVYTGPEPTRESTVKFNFIFTDWYTYDTEENIVWGLQPATSHEAYFAGFAEYLREYTVIFVDWDGTEIEIEYVPYGGSASAPVNPEREGYTFTGWEKDFSHVEGDMVITAQYEQNSTPITYTILFVNWDNALLQTLNITEGELPVYTEATPIRPDDEQYTYTFIGWTPEIVAAIADATYTATYEAKDIHEGFEDIDASSAPRKVLINNVIYILRGEKTYTLQGQETIVP